MTSESNTELKKQIRSVLEYNTDDRGHIRTDDAVIDLCEIFEERGDTHIDVLVDSLHQLAGEADELKEREDVDDHLQHVIEGLRLQAQDVQDWLNSNYYIDPVSVVDDSLNSGGDD